MQSELLRLKPKRDTFAKKSLAIFITSKNLESIAFHDDDSITSVAILGRSDFDALSNELRNQFSRIHIVDEVVDQDSLIKLPIKAEVSSAILDSMCAANASPEETVLICTYEGALLSIAEIRKEFGIPGVAPDQIKPYRNKALMKDRVAKAGLRVPGFAMLDWQSSRTDPNATFATIRETVGLPFIAKPVSSSGTRGVLKICDFSDFQGLVQNGLMDTAYEVEEFIDGDLFTCDFLTADGEIAFGGVSLYFTPMLNYLSGATAGSIALLPEDELYNSILDFGKACLRAIGVFDSCYHLEIFRKSDGELVFLEGAARAPGFQVTRMYEAVFGISMLNEEFRSNLGLPSQIQGDIKAKGGSFWAIVPLREGRISQLNEPELTCEVERSWHVGVGDTVSNSFANKDRALELLAWHADPGVVRSDFERFRTFTAIEYEGDGIDGERQ